MVSAFIAPWKTASILWPINVRYMYPGGQTGLWSAGDNYSTFCVSSAGTGPESERVHASIKDNTINKIYNITNNAVGSIIH